MAPATTHNLHSRPIASNRLAYWWLGWGLLLWAGTGDLADVRAGAVLVPAGACQVGDPFGDSACGGFVDEQPTHGITTRAFRVETHETTRAQWEDVCAWGVTNGYPDLSANPDGAAAATAADRQQPVVNVSWYDAIKWCNARSQHEGLLPVYYTDATRTNLFREGCQDLADNMVRWDADGYRLPTEVEWERAARGGLDANQFPWPSAGGYFLNDLSHAMANYYDPLGDNGPRAVGYYDGHQDPPGPDMANGFGLYDMAGNVAEWCWDWYDDQAYAPWQTNAVSRGTERFAFQALKYRASRGGSWFSCGSELRCAFRDALAPGSADRYQGFRSVRSLLPVDQVEVTGLTLHSTTQGVMVYWEAAIKTPLLGFDLYRWNGQDQWQKVNTALIPWQTPDAPELSFGLAMAETNWLPGCSSLWMPVAISATTQELAGGAWVCAISGSTLNVTARDVSGLYPAGIRIRRHTSSRLSIDQRLTGNNNAAVWTGIAGGRYYLEVYATDTTHGVNELWCDGDPLVPTNGAASTTCHRFLPHVNDVRVYNGAQDVTGSSVPAGTTVRVATILRNPYPGSRTVRSLVWFSPATNLAAAYCVTNAAASIGNWALITQAFEVVVSATGTYYRAARVLTTWYGTNRVTDAAGWTRALTVTPSTGSTLNVGVRDVTGLYPAGVQVWRYTISRSYLDQRLTGASGTSTWFGIAGGRYYLEVYATDTTHGVNELWCDGDPLVPTNGAASTTCHRFLPHVNDVRVYNGAQDVTGSSVPAGTTVRVATILRNPYPGSRTVRSLVWFSPATNLAAAYCVTNAAASIGNWALITQAFEVVVSATGTYYRAARVLTAWYGTNRVTDAAGWTRALTVTSSTGSTLNVGVRDVTGLYPAGVQVWRYTTNRSYLDQRLTGASGTSTWFGIAGGRYYLEVYATDTTHGVNELWCDGDPLVPTNGAASTTCHRFLPHVNDVRVYNGAQDVTGSSVPAGTTVRVATILRNPYPGSRTVRSLVWFSPATNLAAAYCVTNAAASIGNWALITQAFEVVVSATGTYYRAARVLTTWYGTNRVTDAAGWARILTVNPAARAEAEAAPRLGRTTLTNAQDRWPPIFYLLLD